MNDRINAINDAISEMIAFITAQGIDAFSDDVKLAFAQMLSEAADQIEQIRQQENSSLNPQIPQLEPGPFESSNVNSFKYNPNNQQLFVKFHGKDSADSGPIYSYQGIPKHIYDVFSRGAVAPKTSGSNRYHTWIKGVTPSLGASLNALIKNGNYPYQKMS